MQLAHRSSLAVVETIGFPIAGWAAWFGAVNLLTGEPTTPLPPPIADAVKSLAFYGNNGFGDQFGKRQARRIADDLQQEDVDWSIVLSASLAAGVSPRGVKNLGKLVDTHVG